MIDRSQNEKNAEDRNEPEQKIWSTPAVIVSAMRDAQSHVTVFTDGYSPTGHIFYGS